MSDMESSIGLRRSPMEILGMGRGLVRNECGPDQGIGHGYDTPTQNIVDFTNHPNGGQPTLEEVGEHAIEEFVSVVAR